MKKVVINIILVILALILYFLQANFFNWFNIAGIMPNTFVIYVLFVGLYTSRTRGTVYGVVLGLILDLVIGTRMGIYAIGFGIIGFISGTFDKNFSKDSRMTIMLMVLGTTLIFEVLKYILSIFFILSGIEIVNFIKIVAIEVLFNIIITIIIYPLIQKFGYFVENEYKGNKILTRYF